MLSALFAKKTSPVTNVLPFIIEEGMLDTNRLQKLYANAVVNSAEHPISDICQLKELLLTLAREYNVELEGAKACVPYILLSKHRVPTILLVPKT